jgi:hypothetical protein
MSKKANTLPETSGKLSSNATSYPEERKTLSTPSLINLTCVYFIAVLTPLLFTGWPVNAGFL